jgi:hypothetical protein
VKLTRQTLAVTADVKPDETVQVVVNAGQRVGYSKLDPNKRTLVVLDKFQRRLIRQAAKQKRRAQRRAARRPT